VAKIPVAFAVKTRTAAGNFAVCQPILSEKPQKYRAKVGMLHAIGKAEVWLESPALTKP
jgi:hypothetical protein